MNAPSMVMPRAANTRPFTASPSGWPVYRLLAIMTGVIAMVVTTGGFVVESHDLPSVGMVALSGIATAMALRCHGHGRAATVIEGWLLLPVSSMTAIFLTMVLAPLAPPYADPLLHAADRVLLPFLDWSAMVISLRDHQMLVSAMEVIYRSLGWQPFVLIAALAAVGRQRDAFRFLHAWLLALIACVAIFALMPAVTPYVFFGFVPGDVPNLTVDAGWTPHRALEALRDGSTATLSIQAAEGLITFPSFHAAGATLLAWGFYRVPVLGVPFVALNVMMLPTIPMIGSHYFVDVVAGVAIAALAIRGSAQYARATANPTASTIASLARLSGKRAMASTAR